MRVSVVGTSLGRVFVIVRIMDEASGLALGGATLPVGPQRGRSDRHQYGVRRLVRTATKTATHRARPRPTRQRQRARHPRFRRSRALRTSGGWGIRTPEGFHPTRFPSVRHRPLGESSWPHEDTGPRHGGRTGLPVHEHQRVAVEAGSRRACPTRSRTTRASSPTVGEHPQRRSASAASMPIARRGASVRANVVVMCPWSK